MPLYCSMTKVPRCLQVGSIANFTLESTFWIFNLVANTAYTKYKFSIEDIKPVQKDLEDGFQNSQAATEEAALKLYKKKPAKAVDFLTKYSISQVETVHKRWTELWHSLVVKYNDGYINDVKKSRGRAPKSSGYGNEFLKKVVEQNPDYYKVEWKEKKPNGKVQ
jgi:dipeptidase